MATIDARLLDCASRAEVEENFNRILAIIDGTTSDLSDVTADVTDLSAEVTALEGITTCTVTFDSDGGTEVSSQRVRYGGVATDPDDPTKEGNVFAGWFNGETEYDFATEVKTDLTLIAHWTAE